MTDYIKPLLVVVFAIACAVGGYAHGSSVTAARYEAAMAGIRQEHAERETDRALALTGVLELANKRQAEAAQKAAALEKKLLEANAALARERKAQNTRIADAVQTTRDACAGLGPEWVRLYNEFTAPGADSQPGNRGAAPADAAGAAGTSGAAASGVSPGDRLTSIADLLGHARDYGEYCRSLELRARGWVDYYEVHDE
jgi:hypothetical protein